MNFSINEYALHSANVNLISLACESADIPGVGSGFTTLYFGVMYNPCIVTITKDLRVSFADIERRYYQAHPIELAKAMGQSENYAKTGHIKVCENPAIVLDGRTIQFGA